jgi:hypothetical protein
MNKDVVVYILRISSQFSSKDCTNARLVAPFVRKDYLILQNFKSWTGFVKLKNVIKYLRAYLKASKNVIHFANICFMKNKDIFTRICDEDSSTYWFNQGPIHWFNEIKYLYESEQKDYWLYFVNILNEDVEISECSFRFGNRIIDSSLCSRILDVHTILDDLEIKNQIIVLID